MVKRLTLDAQKFIYRVSKVNFKGESTMTGYISAKEFRQRFSQISEDLKQYDEIIVLKRSKPLFRILPFEAVPSDLIDRAATLKDDSQMDLEEISRIVHDLRGTR
jgi:antitoxin (DNA-binding transcriptional repressor) of toxin-antitoxin stability system